MKKVSVLIAILPLIFLGGCMATTPAKENTISDEALAKQESERLLIKAADAVNRGQTREALKNYLSVLKLDAENPKALTGIGNAFLVDRKPQKAELFFTKSLEIYPDDVVASEGRGLCNLTLKNYDVARTDFLSAVKGDANRWRSWNGLGILADLNGENGDAIGYYNKAISIMPDSPVILNNYGYSQIKNKNYRDAEKALRKGLAITPKNPGLINNLGTALAWQQRYNEAVRVIATALPEASAYNNVGYVAMQQGELSLAKKYFKKALEISPSYHVQAAKNLELVESLLSTAEETAAN